MNISPLVNVNLDTSICKFQPFFSVNYLCFTPFLDPPPCFVNLHSGSKIVAFFATVKDEKIVPQQKSYGIVAFPGNIRIWNKGSYIIAATIFLLTFNVNDWKYENIIYILTWSGFPGAELWKYMCIILKIEYKHVDRLWKKANQETVKNWGLEPEIVWEREREREYLEKIERAALTRSFIYSLFALYILFWGILITCEYIRFFELDFNFNTTCNSWQWIYTSLWKKL